MLAGEEAWIKRGLHWLGHRYGKSHLAVLRFISGSGDPAFRVRHPEEVGWLSCGATLAMLDWAVNA